MLYTFRNHFYRFVLAFFVVIAFLEVPYSNAMPPAGAKPQAAAPEYRPGELLVKFHEGVLSAQAEAVAKAHGAIEARRFKPPRKLPHAAIGRWWHVKLGKGQNLKKVQERLAKDPTVEAVELNYVVRTATLPNDPRYPELWGLNNIGQTGGTADADIDAPEAWDIHTGSSNVLVAVIDTGVAYDHPDLAANAWINTGEIPGNGIDDDGNGYVDDVHGYDFYNLDADPYDDHGHGTHVAGTIAAVGDNGVGVVGVSWQARVMAVKFLGAGGSGYTSGAISAVLYATDMGARVMNNSWGGGGFSQALMDAITAANDADALFVAAAGNSSSSNDTTPHYPSSYNVPNVLAVAATDHNDAMASFSNYGATSVHLGAPGVDILSSVPTTVGICCSDPSGYKLLSGTSMATPHASGAAALLLAQNPARAALGVKSLLMGTVDPLAALAGKTVSGGRLNIHNAISCSPTQMSLTTKSPSPNFNLDYGQPTTIAALTHSCGTPITGAQMEAAFSSGEPTLLLHDDGLHGDGAASDGVYAAAWTPTRLDALSITITATHPAFGSVSQTVSGQVRQRIMYVSEQTAYAWNDITGGTRHALMDDSSVTIPIGFAFEFFGNTYANVIISSNGFLTFSSIGSEVYVNTSIPSTSVPNNFVASFWDDLNPGAGGAVYSLLEGEAPNRRLTIAWVDVPHYSVGGAVSFEAILLEGSNEIIVQYRDVIFGASNYDAGGNATVGVENADGTDGMQYLYNQPLLADATALKWRALPFNHRPVASVGGPYQGYVNEPVVFNGTASNDPEGQPLTYLWSFGDGSTGTGPTPSHVYTSKGTFTVSLVVNDVVLNSLPATTTVTIPNRAPVAAPGGAYLGYVGMPITFDGSGSYDPDGDAITSYWWRFGDYSSGSGVSPSYTFNWRGTYTVTLWVSDGTTGSPEASTTVKVISPIPIANAGPDQNVESRAVITLDGRGSYDEDGTIVSYAWRQVAGKDVRMSGADTATPTFTAPPFNAPCPIGSILEFELTVTDNDGNSATDKVAVTIYGRGCWILQRE